MSEINAMIDWTLSHTQIPGPFKIDLVYAEDTPEEPAMLDLAASSFSLHYERKPA